MNLISRMIFALIAFGLASCAITTPTIQHTGPVLHVYRIHVTDIDGKPLSGVSVTSTVYDHTARIADSVQTTDAGGLVESMVRATADTSDNYSNAYESKCVYSIFKIGYLPEYGTAMNSYVLTDLNTRGQKGKTEKSIDVQLLSVNDLVGSDVQSMEDTAAKNILLRYAEAIHNHYAEKGIKLPPHSLTLVPKNDQKYLSIVLNTPNIMNSDMLDNEGFARTFFEVAGRPTLELFRDDADRLPMIDGFSITLGGTKKHFMNTGDDPVALHCQYFVPKHLFTSIDSRELNWKFLAGSEVLVDGTVVAMQNR